MVLFLNARGREMPSVFGLNQGVFRVSRDGDTSRRMVTPPVLARGSAPEPLVRGAADRKPMPLEVFGAQVQELVAETARGLR
jgi:hypothetical protein